MTCFTQVQTSFSSREHFILFIGKCNYDMCNNYYHSTRLNGQMGRWRWHMGSDGILIYMGYLDYRGRIKESDPEDQGKKR